MHARSTAATKVSTLSWNSVGRRSSPVVSSHVHKRTKCNASTRSPDNTYGRFVCRRLPFPLLQSRSINHRASYSLNRSPPPATTATSYSSLCRWMSGGGLRIGTDLLMDSLEHGNRKKIVFDGYGSSGFDVKGTEYLESGAMIHMGGSVLAFPNACYLWKPVSVKEVTLESLAAVTLHEPKVDILIVGSQTTPPPRLMNILRKSFREKGIVVEHMDLMHACATFNVLNGEDRNVAAAMICDDTDDEED